MHDSQFAQALEEYMPQQEKAQGDYIGAGGLLMCGVCNTPKQFRIDVPGDWYGKIVTVLCRCETERRERETSAIRRMAAQKEIEALRKQGLREAQYTDSTFALDDQRDPATSQYCRNYVQKWGEMSKHNFGIMLYGDVGNGKTFLASCIANALLDTGTAVLMTTIPALSTMMQDNFGANRALVLDQVAKIPLLILDDVGMQRNTPAAMENAYDIINTRYKAKKPLIITTNLTVKVLETEKEMQLRRIYDRLLEMCRPVLLKSIRRRKDIAERKIVEMDSILAE